MPELPEVEEVRRTLEPSMRDVPMESVQVRRADFVTPKNADLQSLAGHRLIKTHRHGKKLFLVMDGDQTLVLHLGMSGRVDAVPHEEPIAKHTHVIFSLASGTDIRLRDPRRFGGLSYYPSLDAALREETTRLGPDALTVTAGDFAHWKNSRGRIKQRLLSQADVAGLGNIYVDEALWAAHIHPLQSVRRLRPHQLTLLVETIKAVLTRSIDSGGTTLRDYYNVANQPGRFARQLQAYGHAGHPCPRCTTTMRAILVSGRTTVFCPTCQKRR